MSGPARERLLGQVDIGAAARDDALLGVGGLAVAGYGVTKRSQGKPTVNVTVARMTDGLVKRQPGS
jgi:hypothetical protein